MTRWPQVAPFLAAAIFTSVFFIDFCGLVYACGCRSLWAGADAACNIHNHGGKHCPWCSIGLLPSVGVWAIIVLSQAFVSFRLPGLGTTGRTVATFAAFPLTGGMLALILGLWTGYWS